MPQPSLFEMMVAAVSPLIPFAQLAVMWLIYKAIRDLKEKK